MGIYGSYLCAVMNLLCLIAQFYVALYPVGGPNLNANYFFQAYLAGPFLIALYVIWKVYSWIYIKEHRPLYVKVQDIDIYTGMRDTQRDLSGPNVDPEYRRQSIMEIQAAEPKRGPMGWVKATVQSVF
jgi:amino acid transporter